MQRHQLLALVLAPLSAGAAEPRTGEQIYKKQCATCHGAAGEGSKVYPHPLAGEKPLPQLTKLIAKTMPEDDPGILSASDADAVAKFVFDTYYSKDARDRRPPRVELSRLTVRQYRNAVADLIGTFRGPATTDDRHGLRGQYFKGGRMQNSERTIDRIDPQVSFDFRTDSPDPGKIEPQQFSIRWEGTILAPETGDYEFVVRTEHAARLWINDLNRPLIDAWVKSGTDTEFRGSIFLLAGRTYALKLEFSKALQGVQKDKVGPPVQASVALLWKRPRGVLATVGDRYLSPGKASEVFVPTVAFPPDDRSLGWERGSAVSKAWDQATTDAAIDTAGYVGTRLGDLAGAKPGAADREAKAREFCKRFVERAFRRPLPDEQKTLFIDRQFEAAKGDTELAVKRVVVLTLKSPRFLYKEGAGRMDGYAVAERLAFALWDSLPDKQLLDAAAAGKLVKRDEVTAQATRMLADPRAKVKLHEFLLTWLKADQTPELIKDAKRFPNFDPAIAADLRTSLELLLDDVLWSEPSDFRQLLMNEDVFLNGRLAKFYLGDPTKVLPMRVPDEAPFRKVRLDSGKRAGVLTHPYLMSAFAYTGTSSPIHRGVFLARGVLGRTLRPPQDAFTPLPEDLHPTLTTRERVALQTKGENCQACHGLINPLGFTLENYDAVGRYRDKENGHTVDVAGSYLTRTGSTVTFAAARDLATFLAANDEVHATFAEKLFHHLAQQPVRAYGANKRDELRQSFAAGGFNMRKLAVEVAVTAAQPTR
jgi:Protein of unknown function (DUF1592)/Protein of unknown function (DUF1588)/PA14 domain/Protein of unknown function (DUF1595)/Cytochrome C oxidase, cbb3-type, subunit III